MRFVETEGLTFDDVLIAPEYSDITTRASCDTSVNFLGIEMKIPIISANMDLVTGGEMAVAMHKAGGLGILHRFYHDWNRWADDVSKVATQTKIPVAFSVGVRDTSVSVDGVASVAHLYGDRPVIATIDVAHGHHEQVANLVYAIHDEFPDVKIIAGNVATADGAFYLYDAGANAIKVGIGPGAACTTRVVTGIGVPQLSAIAEVANAMRPYKVPVIADGGIRSSGDIVKALAAGANVVMLGQLLAGAKECPGEVVIGTNGRRYRRYTGQSTYGVNGYKYTMEGVAGFVEEKGPVEEILKQLVGGLRSGMSYVGARNLQELKEKARFIRVSHHTYAENQPRIRETVI